MDSRVGQGCSLWADPGSRKMAFLIINQALCEMWETEGLPRTVGNRRFSMVRHFHQGIRSCGIGGNVDSHFHGFHRYQIKNLPDMHLPDMCTRFHVGSVPDFTSEAYPISRHAP
jgi:hypothetical protein